MTATLIAKRPTPRLDVLRVTHVRGFFGLIAVGSIADAITTLAIAHVVVFRLAGGTSPSAIAQGLLTMTLPSLVAGPLAGIVSDRWDRRRVLRGAHLARGLITLVAISVPVLESRQIGYLLTSLLLGLTSIGYNARATGLPHLVNAHQLLNANSLMSLTAKVAGSAGFALSAVLLTSSPIHALLVAGLLQSLAALGWQRFPHDLGGRNAEALEHDKWSVAARRVLRLATTGHTRRAILTAAYMRVGLGATFVSLLLWVDARLDPSAVGYALVLSVGGTGAFVGTVITPFVCSRIRRRTIVITAFVIGGSTCSLAGALPMRETVMLAMFASAVCMQLVHLLTDATVQHAIADDALGRVYSVYNMSYSVASLIGAFGALAIPTDMPSVRFLLVALFGVIGALGQCWPPSFEHPALASDFGAPVVLNPFKRSPRRSTC